MNKKAAVLGKQNPIAIREAIRRYINNSGYDAVILDMETRDISDFYDELRDFDAVISCGEKVPVIAVNGLAEGKVKLISRWGIGTDEIDCAEAASHGIAVCNAAGTLSSAVAECAVGMMISLLRSFNQADAEVRRGDWSRFFEGKNGRQLEGKTIGLIGFGDIAKALAKMLYGFDCRLLAYDIKWDEESAKRLHVERTDIPVIQRESDIISLHVPATSETCDMVNTDFLKAMKRDAILINTGRGKLIVEEDLAEALKTGVIAAAGLDVFRKEPPDPDNPLIHLPNVMVLPHAGAGTVEAITKAGLAAAKNTVDFFNDKPVPTILNPDYLYHFKA